MNKNLKGVVYKLHHLYELDKEILITKTRISKDTLLKKGYESFIEFLDKSIYENYRGKKYTSLRFELNEYLNIETLRHSHGTDYDEYYNIEIYGIDSQIQEEIEKLELELIDFVKGVI